MAGDRSRGLVRIVVNPRFGAEAQRAQEAFREETTRLVADTVVEVTWRLARRTPVLLGRARGNWNVGVNAPDLTYDEEGRRDPTGQSVVARARDVAATIRLGDVVYASNAAPHITFLNDGGSRKAPAGFVEQTAAELPMIVALHAEGMRDRLHGRGPQLGRRP